MNEEAVAAMRAVVGDKPIGGHRVLWMAVVAAKLRSAANDLIGCANATAGGEDGPEMPNHASLCSAAAMIDRWATETQDVADVLALILTERENGVRS